MNLVMMELQANSCDVCIYSSGLLERRSQQMEREYKQHCYDK